MSAPQPFLKKPVQIKAMQWDGTADGATTIIAWILANGGNARYECSDPDRCAQHDGDCPHYIAIDTLEGTMRAGLSDFVIEGIAKEFYPCKPDIFVATYDPVEGSRTVTAHFPAADSYLMATGYAALMGANADRQHLFARHYDCPVTPAELQQHWKQFDEETSAEAVPVPGEHLLRCTDCGRELVTETRYQFVTPGVITYLCRDHFLERDAARRNLFRPDPERGLYPKYRVEKLSGKPVGEVFVLEAHDPFALDAISVYAVACSSKYPQLSVDLAAMARRWHDNQPSKDS
ncbi:hypothetical protein BH11ACT6_BH11ACT6_34760 [soil metagenome]